MEKSDCCSSWTCCCFLQKSHDLTIWRWVLTVRTGHLRRNRILWPTGKCGSPSQQISLWERSIKSQQSSASIWLRNNEAIIEAFQVTIVASLEKKTSWYCCFLSQIPKTWEIWLIAAAVQADKWALGFGWGTSLSFQHLPVASIYILSRHDKTPGKIFMYVCRQDVWKYNGSFSQTHTCRC